MQEELYDEETSADRIVYAISEDDLQIAAWVELGRGLTEAEVDRCARNIGQYISFVKAVCACVRFEIGGFK